jgi:hypothetical protein
MDLESKASRPSRKIPPRIAKRVRLYGVAVGELVWASNFCLTAFNLLYRQFFSRDDRLISVNVWHSQRMDKNQMELLRAAVAGSKPIPFELHRRIIWAISRQEKLAEHRNDAVHSYVNINDQNMQIRPSSIATHPNRYARLAARSNMKRFFRTVRDDFFHLGNYAHLLWNHMYSLREGVHLPLPRKPTLRSVTNNPLPSKKDLGLTL